MLEGGAAATIRDLLTAPGSPGALEVFRDVSGRSRAMLGDRQLAALIAGAAAADDAAGRRHTTPDAAVGFGLALLEAADKAGHVAGAEAHLAAMRLCWAANSDDARRLLLDLHARLLSARDAARTLLASNRAAMAVFEPSPDAWILAMKAAVLMLPVPRDELRTVLQGARRAAEEGQNCTTQPLLWSALYSGYMCVDEREAWVVFQRATGHHRCVSPRAWAEYLSHAGSVRNALRMLGKMEGTGLTPGTKIYNSCLLAGQHGEKNRLAPATAKEREQAAREVRMVLDEMRSAAVRPDGQTLGIVASAYRRLGMGREAHDVVMGLRDEHRLQVARSCLTSIIAAQVDTCAHDPESVGRAERCMVEILEGNLLAEPPHRTAYQCFGRLMLCYARAGEVARLETLRDSFYVRLHASQFLDPTTRPTQLLRTAYTEAYAAAARRAMGKDAPPPEWGGPLHSPWLAAGSDASLEAQHPDAGLEGLWP